MLNTRSARGWTATIVVALMLAAAGCGARGAPEGPTSGGSADERVAVATRIDPTEAATASVPPPAATAESQDTGHTAHTAAPTAPAAAEPWPEVDYGPRHNLDTFTISLSSDCVRQGDLLTVTLQGPPNAGVSMVIAYADRRPHGNSKGVGESDADGRYVWRVVVAPTAPLGEAKILASTSGANWEGDGASADRLFTVASRC